MEAARKLKANLKLDNKPCGWCNRALHVGDDAAVCHGCQKEHHDACWESKAGCASPGCVNAPLQRLDALVGVGAAPGASAGPAAFAAAALPPGQTRCPKCGYTITFGTELCPMCRAITSPDGIYRGPRFNAPGAVSSMVMGIIGLFFCGVVLGPLAISNSSKARRAIAMDPTLTGGGMATAGMVLGIIDLVFFLIFVMIRLSLH
jgi:hypothetical protein